MDASVLLCRHVEAWLEAQRREAVAPAFFCDKEGLSNELNELMRGADKKERKQLTKQFDARRVELEARMTELVERSLPAIFKSFDELHTSLRPLLAQAEASCSTSRSAMAAMPLVDRAALCRVFYDGTADDVFSNFKPFRFAVGGVGFMKGEQFFHVAKAMLCGDLRSASLMMLTTGGPKLRSLGREVANYEEFGGSWEDVDSGLLLLVCTVIKLAALQPERREDNAQLLAELTSDGRVEQLYIAEGAKDDSRCGIGLHAEQPDILERIDQWGRNQLGHACMAVARYLGHESSTDADTLTELMALSVSPTPQPSPTGKHERAAAAGTGDEEAQPAQVLLPAKLMADERYERRTCGMHRELLAQVREGHLAGTTSLRALCDRLLEAIELQDAAVVIAPPLGPPSCAVARGATPAVVIWLLLDPLDIDSKQTTFVLRGAAASEDVLSEFYKWNPVGA